MWPFTKNKIKEQLNKIKSEVELIELNNQLNQYKTNLAALRDQSTYRPQFFQPSNVKESLATNLLASNALEKTFMGAVALWEIPAMIRNQWPYKQILIQTIVQLDFVRWVGRVLYADCPTFSTAIEAITSQILGANGLTYKCFSKEPGENEALIKEVNDLIDEIDDYNNIHNWEKEVLLRWHKEGEVFIFIQKSDRSIDEDIPEIRVIEPDFIRPSIIRGQSQEDPNVSTAFSGGEDWSFGIHNKPFKWYRPEKYNVCWPPDYAREDVLDAKDVFHWANKEGRNQKRGIPTSFRVTEDLINITLHREADAQSAIKRARITGIVQYTTNIDPSYVRTDLSELGKTDKIDKPESEIYSIATLGLNTQESDWVGVLKGREFKEFPPIDAASTELIYKRGLATIAAYYGLPLATFGISNEQSFASSLIEETIPTRRREAEQGDLCNYMRGVMKRCIELMLGEELWDKVDIRVTGPTVVIRDEKTQVESHAIKLQEKLESKTTAMADLGLDTAEEISNMESEEKIDVLQPEVGPQENFPAQPKSDSGVRQKLEGDKELSTK